MKKTGIPVLVVLLALCEWGGWPAGGWSQPSDPPARHAPRLERFIEELGLEAQTLAQVDAIIDASRAKKQALRHQLRAARKQMRSLLEAEQPQEAKLLEQADYIGGMRTELRKEQLKTMLRVRALLSPEQRARLLERFNKRPRRGYGRRRGVQSSPPPDEAR